MILWNMVLLGVLCGTHFVISRVPYLQKWKQWLMHPYLSLTVASLLYQGSTFAAYMSIFQGEVVYLPLTLATIGMSIGLPIWIWRWLQMTTLAWYENHKSMVWAPQGVWEPAFLVSTHGMIFDEFNDKGRWFKVVVFAYGHLIALTTSVMPTSTIGCQIQIAAYVIFILAMTITYVHFRPLRWQILNWSRCTTLLLQAIQLELFRSHGNAGGSREDSAYDIVLDRGPSRRSVCHSWVVSDMTCARLFRPLR